MNDDRKTWKHKGSAGQFHVWHAGKNLYYVTDSREGWVVGCRSQFGLAFSLACQHDLLAKYEGASA